MEKKIELMKDKNGITMRTGDIVKIENAYFKNDNGFWFIDRSPGDASWNGSYYSLKKIGKRGKISTAKYNLAFWPLSSYCSDQRKNWAADAHNKDNATIEIVDCIDNTEVIEHFREEARKSAEQAKYYEMRGYDWEKWAKVYSDTADHYEKVIERISSGDITKGLTVEPEAPTETAQKPQEEPEAMEGDTDTTAEGKEPEKATENTQEEKKEMIYKYGMRLRGFSIGCQPAGVVERLDDTTGKYLDIIAYNRPLTAEEMRTYSLDDLNGNKINRILTEYAAETTVTDEAAEIHTEDKKGYVETYTQPSTGQKIAVEEIKGKYYNIYGYDTKEAVKAGGFETIEKAREMIQKHRPGSIIDGEPAPKEKTATPSPVSKSDTEETPEENSDTPSGVSKNYAMGSGNTEGKSDTPSGDEKSYTAKTAVKYYEISEETARRAHEMMSFRDYKKNPATDEYRASVDRAAEVAEEQKRKVSPYYHAKIDALLDRYARRLAEWTNAYNRNRASCPSVMVCGPANFPTRKKQKQNSREDALWKEYEDIKGILDKITSIGAGAIDLADPHAKELLQERLDSLKGQLELDKKLNTYWRKHKSFIGCPDISADFAEKLTKETADIMERCAWMSKPFPDYELASLRDKIKRTQARLDQLNTMQEKAKNEDGRTEKFDGGEILHNYEQNRLQILFNEKPDEETRQNLKSHGFHWSPRNNAWQRQLTANAERAAHQVLKLA